MYARMTVPFYTPPMYERSFGIVTTFILTIPSRCVIVQKNLHSRFEIAVSGFFLADTMDLDLERLPTIS